VTTAVITKWFPVMLKTNPNRFRCCENSVKNWANKMWQ